MTDMSPADWVRNFHRQMGMQVDGEPATPAAPQMAASAVAMRANLAPETVAFLEETSPETAALLQLYGVPQHDANDHQPFAEVDEEPREMIAPTADHPAVSGLGEVSGMDYRSGAVNLAPGAVAAARDAAYDAERIRFRRKPPEPPTVGNANLFQVAGMSTNGR